MIFNPRNLSFLRPKHRRRQSNGVQARPNRSRRSQEPTSTPVQPSETGVRQQYSVIVHCDAEDDIYYADVPTLGFVTQGDSYEDAFAMAEDAIIGRLETTVATGQPIPVEDHPFQLRQVTV